MLESLDLSSNGLNATDLLHIALCHFPNLKHLCLSYNSIHHAMQQPVSSNWPKLEPLSLSQAFTSNAHDNVAEFVKGQWSQLQTLDLNDNEIDEPALITLCQATIPRLAKLDLCDCKLDSSHFTSLVRDVDILSSSPQPLEICRQFWPQLSDIWVYDVIEASEVEH